MCKIHTQSAHGEVMTPAWLALSAMMRNRCVHENTWIFCVFAFETAFFYIPFRT